MAFELTIAEGTDRGRRFRFEAAEVTIGRGLASDLLLLDPGVSRSHARIRAEDGSHVLLDVGSSNGTALNGVPVQGAAGLSPGDRIGVGPLVFEFGPARSAARWIARAQAAVARARHAFFLRPARACALAAAGSCLLAGAVASVHGREASAGAAASLTEPATGKTAAPLRLEGDVAGQVGTAQAWYERGRRKLEERRVAPRNLYDAWKSFSAAGRLLDGRPATPPLDALPRLIDEAERDLRSECRKLLFTARRFQSYGEEVRAQAAYREMLVRFPGLDPGGCRAAAREELSELAEGEGSAR